MHQENERLTRVHLLLGRTGLDRACFRAFSARPIIPGMLSPLALCATTWPDACGDVLEVAVGNLRACQRGSHLLRVDLDALSRDSLTYTQWIFFIVGVAICLAHAREIQK